MKGCNMAGGNQVSVVFDEFLFLKIFRAFRMAIQPTKLIITSAALAMICLSGWLMDFSQSVAVVRDINKKIVLSELQVYMASPSTQGRKIRHRTHSVKVTSEAVYLKFYGDHPLLVSKKL